MTASAGLARDWLGARGGRVRDHVPDDDGQEFLRRGVLRFLAVLVRGVEVLVPRVGVQGGSRDADGQEREVST